MDRAVSRNCILVVDDTALNRARVEQAFEGMYQVIHAENGMIGLERLRENIFGIAAIILDMNMPVFTGMDFLREYHSNPYLFGIPVIVTTSEDPKKMEKECLELGAVDFVKVPYDTSILVHRVVNAINNCWFKRNENDLLTGVFNSGKFQVEVVKLLMSHLDLQFAMVMMDIDNFKTYNDYFGVKEGDRLIQTFARLITDEVMKSPYAVWGRYAADIFSFCIPYEEERIQEMVVNIRDGLHRFNPDYIIKPSMGVYLIDDVDLDPEIMQDRAFLAAKQCKGKYEHFVSYYDQGMSNRMLTEQQIISEMNRAIKQEEFVVYYQPKYNLKSGLPDGAEALVRWLHPKKGLLTPSFFVPIFEKNGFITKLDFYVWERVCRFLQRRIQQKKKIRPISVNVSLVNMYNPNFAQNLYNLVQKYEVPTEYLALEFTESTFFENTDLVQNVMNQLHELGFVIYMDDFGSGYSSLNMLHTLPVDTLKIDKEFLPKNPYEERGGRVLAAVTRMAGWLNMPVIVEGAENPQQISFLREAGCDYVQGFFFARPMNEMSYEQLLDRRDGGRLLLPEESPHGKMLTELWTSDALVEKLFENIAQPMAVIQVTGEEITTLRVNSAFLDSYGAITSGDYVTELVSCIPQPDDRQGIRNAIQNAVNQKHSAQCDFSCVIKKENIWLSAKFQFVEKIMGHASVLTMVLSDISERIRVQEALGRSEQEAEFQEQYASIVLRNARIIAWSYDVQNNLFRHREDYNEDIYVEELVDVPEKLIRRNLIHPDDVEDIISMYESLRKGAAKAEGIFRLKTSSINELKYRYYRIRYTNTFDKDGRPFRAVGMMQDVTDWQEMQASYYTELDFNQMLNRDTAASVLINLTSREVEKEQILVDPKERLYNHVTYDNYMEVLKAFMGSGDAEEAFISKMGPEELAAAFHRGQQYFQHVFHKVWHRTGRRTWMSLEVYVRTRSDSEDLLAQIYIKDINEQTLRIKELEEAASLDQMTGLYNHDTFIRRMQQYLENDGKEGVHTLFMIDINDFKKLNDTYGHHIGDMAILRITEELNASFRKTDILGRFGGDEFMVLAKNIGSEQLSILKKKHLMKALDLSVEKDGQLVPFSCSIGESVCVDGNKDYFQMFNEADEQMYKGKKRRKKESAFVDSGRSDDASGNEE